MKVTIFALFLMPFSLFGAELKVVSLDKIQMREPVGSRLAYIPNQGTPFTGRAESFYPNPFLHNLIKHQIGRMDLDMNSGEGWREGGMKKLLTAMFVALLLAGWYKTSQKINEEN